MNNPLTKANTSIVLKKTKRFEDGDGRFPVKLQVSFERIQKFYSLKGERCTPKEFTEIINPKSKNEKKIKRELFDTVRKKADKIINNLENFTFEEFENEFVGRKGKNASIQEYFEQKASESKIGTAELYRSTIKSLMQFDKNVSFQKITPKYLKEYEKWMVNDENGKTYTTVGMYMRNLRHIMNKAIINGIIKTYPFSTNTEKDKTKYQIPESNNTKKALSLADIEKIFNFKPETQQESEAHLYWLFSYLCAGMNMVDIANLKLKNISGNSIRFIRQKTKDTTKVKKELNIHLLPEALDFIEKLGNKSLQPDDYIFPILHNGMSEKEKYNRVKQHIKNTNKYINRIAKKLGIDMKITTYTARHSYATVLKRNGTSVEFIREHLGHQTSKVTQNYLDSFEDEQKAETSANLINFLTKINIPLMAKSKKILPVESRFAETYLC